jgi:hypothetical protein
MALARHDGPMTTASADITIRPAVPADRDDLERLATLDSARLPTGDLLLAEVDHELVAALNPATGFAIADPFRHTAHVVELLRVRAREAARETRPVVLPGHLGRALFGRA